MAKNCGGTPKKYTGMGINLVTNPKSTVGKPMRSGTVTTTATLNGRSGGKKGKK